MPKQLWGPIFSSIFLAVLIFYGGPKLSAWLVKKNRKKIEKNGITNRAYVYLKNTYKGNSVHFRYQYHGKLFRNNEQNENDYFFNVFNIGDSITILMDSTDPSDSYILK